jgi:trimeric autotransporter adhesin
MTLGRRRWRPLKLLGATAAMLAAITCGDDSSYTPTSPSSSSSSTPISAVTSTLAGLSIAPTQAMGGSTAQGTVTLNAAAGAGGVAVTLSSDKAVAVVPGSVSVPSGQTSATFDVATNTVSAMTEAMITASGAGGTLTAMLQVLPASAEDPKAVSLASLDIPTSGFKGGGSTQATVTLDGPAPAGGTVIALASDDTVATVPASVTVAAGATSATFTISTRTVTAGIRIRITASAGGVSLTKIIHVLADNAIASLSVSPVTIVGGGSATGTVTLSFEGEPGGTVVTLESSRAEARVPTSISIAAGDKTATFTVETNEVSGTWEVLITASVNRDTRSVQIRVVPAQAAAAGGATLNLGGVIN